MREEREHEKVLLQDLPEAQRIEQNGLKEYRYFERWDSYLDRAARGPRWLAQPETAGIVKEAMHFRDGRVIDLHAYCIMLNHVHIVFELLSRSGCQPDHHDGSEYHSDLPKIMQSLKRHTARQSNLILDREGAFWQDESYDHVIRNGDEYTRIIWYVLENPVKAGLISKWEEWPWTYCKPDIL